MIGRIKGKLIKKTEDKIFVDVGGVVCEINVPGIVERKLESAVGDSIEVVTYFYFHIEKNRVVPVIIGFLEELERDFFLEILKVSGIGPKAALKIFNKPVARIAQAIEDGDVELLKVSGVGKQRAKHIVAQLQGKVGRFALIKEEEKEVIPEAKEREIVEEAKQILKRLQYTTKEIEIMIRQAKAGLPRIDSVETLLNEIYRQRR